MRYTVIDATGAVSFVADCNALNSLVAACADSPGTLGELLAAVARYDPRPAEYVSSGLAIFDEHNANGNYQAIHGALAFCMPHELPVFRVVDESTRQASLHSVKAGAILFNLLAKRIVQIQNTYAEIRRKGQVLVRGGKSSITRLHRYELPSEWSLVPHRSDVPD